MPIAAANKQKRTRRGGGEKSVFHVAAAAAAGGGCYWCCSRGCKSERSDSLDNNNETDNTGSGHISDTTNDLSFPPISK